MNDDVLTHLIAPYLPPLIRRRLSLSCSRYKSSQAVVDELVRTWITQYAETHVIWKYDKLVGYPISVGNGKQTVEHTKGYHNRSRNYAVSNRCMMMLAEPMKSPVDVYIGTIQENSESEYPPLMHFTFKMSTQDSNTFDFHHARLESNILSICYSSLLFSRPNNRDTCSVGYHVNSWIVDKLARTRDLLLCHQSSTSYRGLFELKIPHIYGLVNGRIDGNRPQAFSGYYTKGCLCLTIMDLKQSALLMDEESPIYAQLGIINDLDLMQKEKQKTPILSIEIIQRTNDLFTISILVWQPYQRGERWIMIYDYILSESRAHFRNKISLGMICLEYNRLFTFVEHDMIILTLISAPGWTDRTKLDYNHYICTYQHNDELCDLRLFAVTQVDKDKKVETKLS